MRSWASSKSIHSCAEIGARVTLDSERQQPGIGMGWLGRVINGLAEPLDGLGRM